MVFLSSNARKFIIKTGKMHDIPKLPRLIGMVFFYPCDNGRISLKVFSILQALSTLE